MTTRFMIPALVFLMVFALGCHREARAPAPVTDVFDTQVAMRTMFGNFDPVIKSSLSQVPPDVSATSPNFQQGGEIRVRPFFVQEVNENGIRRVYIVTWAKPAGQPFDCKGCAPLISAAVFTPSPAGWKPESLGRAVLTFGDFGKPPEARLLQIGPHAHAFLLKVTSMQERTTVAESLLVPWKGAVQEAMRTVVADSNQGSCGGAYPCFSNQRELQFVPGSDSQYNDIVLTLSGTDLPQNPPYKIRRVTGSERLQFQDGKYVHVERQGDTISAEE